MQLSSCDLKSDFTDYYDEFFTEEGDNPLSLNFLRQSDITGSLTEQVNRLRLAGFLTPNVLSPTEALVSFAPQLPGNQGFRFFRVNNATLSWVKDSDIANDMTSPLLDFYGVPAANFGERYRYVQVGIRSFWLKSDTPILWPAPVPPERFELMELDEPIPARQLRHFRSPVFCVDFIKAANGNLLAVNLDLSPKLIDMCFHKWLKAEDAATSILSTLSCATLIEQEEPSI